MARISRNPATWQGISYEQLLNRIVQLGLNYQPEWRLFE